LYKVQVRHGCPTSTTSKNKENSISSNNYILPPVNDVLNVSEVDDSNLIEPIQSSDKSNEDKPHIVGEIYSN
jgi:hypothetical protein